MLPITLERIEKQLIRWGIPSHLINNMKPWSIISCYASEKKKREENLSSKRYSDVKTVDRPKSNVSKYQGAKAPYRWK
ncbi:MAG: hypothetical protein A4E55_02234 [Pelotomaculum sp. PtaU1.Bin035]|nr:MAG: hypothetical protein A4E55_02234 [Pelotomaculum sp. PtaU1.Bin035]